MPNDTERAWASWQDETVGDLVRTARMVADTSCSCPEGAHQNMLHDLASDILRILGPTSDMPGAAPYYCYPCSRGDHGEHKPVAWQTDIPCDCLTCA